MWQEHSAKTYTQFHASSLRLNCHRLFDYYFRNFCLVLWSIVFHIWHSDFPKMNLPWKLPFRKGQIPPCNWHHVIGVHFTSEFQSIYLNASFIFNFLLEVQSSTDITNCLGPQKNLVISEFRYRKNETHATKTPWRKAGSGIPWRKRAEVVYHDENAMCKSARLSKCRPRS